MDLSEKWCVVAEGKALLQSQMYAKGPELLCKSYNLLEPQLFSTTS